MSASDIFFQALHDWGAWGAFLGFLGSLFLACALKVDKRFGGKFDGKDVYYAYLHEKSILFLRCGLLLLVIAMTLIFLNEASIPFITAWW